jgi:type IV pilus assembly protein PilB
MKIGEALNKEGLITSEQLKVALNEQERTSDRLGDICLKMGFVTPQQMAPFLAEYFEIDFVDIKEIYKDLKPKVIDCVPAELAHRFTVIPIDLRGNTLTIAMYDPLDLLAIDTLRIKIGYKIQCVVAIEHDIIEAIEYCYHYLPRLDAHIENFIESETEEAKNTEQNAPGSSFDAGDQPVVQYVRSLIIKAFDSRASDILLQPKQDTVDLRFRIDGVLYKIDAPPKSMLGAITTRIKIIAGLDIAEQRLPQDGRFKLFVGKTEVDLRISSFPTIYGESVVMRLLDTSSPLLGLEQLGLGTDDMKKFKNLIHHSYGIVLVTGPTGSGKTTTLYTALNAIKSADKNIVTLEDPVEYRLPFIQQSQVNSAIGFDFARGLRSILRQDPDIIMVGEIRDKETAEIAIHAALTGHLVFSTLHTNDAAGAAVRLINMGIEPFLLTSSLLGVVAQRLIRKVCPHCKETYTPEKEILKKLSINEKDLKFTRGKGCEKCFNSGYKGRMGIYELLSMDDGVRNLILNRSSSEDIRICAQKSGMKTLRQIGIEKLKEGLTTPEELLRVTQEADGDINL